jgi:hypothetical protein
VVFNNSTMAHQCRWGPSTHQVQKATRTRRQRRSSRITDLGSSTFRPKVPISTRSRWPSPSSRRTCARPKSGPSIPCGKPSTQPANSTRLTNAGTTSNAPDMLQINGSKLYAAIILTKAAWLTIYGLRQTGGSMRNLTEVSSPPTDRPKGLI